MHADKNENLPTMIEDDTLQVDEKEFSTATCDRCDCISTLPDLFRKSWGACYCPACAVKAEIYSSKIAFGILGVLVLFNWIWGGLFYGFTSWQAWSVISIFIISILSLIFHELSHALAAWSLGGRVFGIHIGMGKQIIRWWFKKTSLSISIFPVSGLCYAGFPFTKRLRLRYAILISGGLLFHLFILFITILFILRTGNRFPILDWIIIINGMMFLLNLWPHTIITAAGPIGSDGKRLWRILTGKLLAKELHQSYYRLAALFAFQQEQADQAAYYIHEGLSRYSDDLFLENLRVFLLLEQEDKLEEAYITWKSIIKSETFNVAPAIQQAVYYNNYAWATLMHQPRSDSLETAHLFAEKAYRMVPWVPLIRGTLAAVFVEQGEYEKGVQWALSAAKEIKQQPSSIRRDKHVAMNLAAAALGCFRLGEQELARTHLQNALTLAPKEITVRKAVAEIISCHP